MTNESANTRDQQLAEVMERYLSDLAAGIRPDTAELMKLHPELGQDLIASLEGLDLLNQFSGLPDPHEEPHTAPIRLGDFQLRREIGRGGMGVVYEADQLSLDRRVALKTLPFAGALDKRQLTRFRREAKSAALLKHEHIVSVHMVGCERGIHFYAMEFIDGTTLADLVAPSTRLGDPVDQKIADPAAETSPVCKNSTMRKTGEESFYDGVAEIGRQVASALAYAHEEGIVHRDVKPSNVLIDQEGHAYLADFGLAHVVSDSTLTTTGDLLGTLRYMAPEQMARGQADARSDIFSLGATLFEVLCGRPLRPETDRQLLISRALDSTASSPARIDRGCPADLDKVIAKCISTDPVDRYQNATALAADFDRFLTRRPVLATRPTPLEVATKLCRRHPRFVGGSFAVMLLLASLVGVLAIALGQTKQAKEVAANEAYTADMRDAFDSWRHARYPRLQGLLERQKQRRDEDGIQLGFEFDVLSRLANETPRNALLEGQGLVYDMRPVEIGDDRFLILASRLHDEFRTQFLAGYDIKTGRQLFQHRPAGLQRQQWMDVSPDGTLMAASADRKIEFYHLPNGDRATEYPAITLEDFASRLSFDHDGESLIIGESRGAVWHIRLDSMERTKLCQMPNYVASMRRQSNGDLIAIGSVGQLHVFNMRTLEPECMPIRNESGRPFHRVSFSPNGNRLATVAHNLVHLWDTNGFELKRTIEFPRKVYAIAWLHDSIQLAAGCSDGAIRLRNLSSDEAFEPIRRSSGGCRRN